MTCGACGGQGTRPVQIYNTETHTWHTLHETCLTCGGSGQQGR